MDQKLFEQIEAYLRNAMTAEERVAFEQLLERDQALREEMEAQLKLINAIETEAMQATLHQIHERQFERSDKGRRSVLIRRLRPLAVAASVALAALAAWWLFLDTGQTTSELFTQYYETPPGLPTSLGVQDNPDFYEGMVDYKLGNLEAARQRWLPLLEQHPGNDTLQFFVGVTYLESNQPDSAIIRFERILDMRNSKYEVPAKWLLGLTLATNNREKEAFPLLQELSQQPNDSYREKAEEVLDILKND